MLKISEKIVFKLLFVLIFQQKQTSKQKIHETKNPDFFLKCNNFITNFMPPSSKLDNILIFK